MNTLDILLILALAAVIALALRRAVKLHKKGGCAGCSGDCACCGHACAPRTGAGK